MVAYAFNLRAWEVEAGGALWIQGHPGLYTRFQGSQNPTNRTLSGEKKPQNYKTAPISKRWKERNNSCQLSFDLQKYVPIQHNKSDLKSF